MTEKHQWLTDWLPSLPERPLTLNIRLNFSRLDSHRSKISPVLEQTFILDFWSLSFDFWSLGQPPSSTIFHLWFQFWRLNSHLIWSPICSPVFVSPLTLQSPLSSWWRIKLPCTIDKWFKNVAAFTFCGRFYRQNNLTIWENGRFHLLWGFYRQNGWTIWDYGRFHLSWELMMEILLPAMHSWLVCC